MKKALSFLFGVLSISVGLFMCLGYCIKLDEGLPAGEETIYFWVLILFGLLPLLLGCFLLFVFYRLLSSAPQKLSPVSVQITHQTPILETPVKKEIHSQNYYE